MYLFIAYRPETLITSYDEVEYYQESDFISKNNLSQEELIKEWAQIYFLGKELRYMVQIYDGGRKIWDDFDTTFQPPYNMVYLCMCIHFVKS